MEVGFDISSMNQNFNFIGNRHTDLLRGPTQGSFDITNRCNLKCLHCFNRSGDNLHRDELSDRQILNIAKQMAEIQPLGFCVCGGEPFLRERVLYDFIKIISNCGTKVNMVTNGTLLNPAKAERLVEAGINNVQVSIDGISAETHDWFRGRRGAFDKSIRAVTTLKDVGLTPMIAFSPNRQNVRDFPAVVEMLVSLGVGEIRVQPLMPLGEAAIRFRELSPSQKQYREMAEYIHCHQWVSGTRLEWGDPVDHLIRFRKHLPEPNLFCTITATGALVVSPYIALEVGNLSRHSFAQYWDAGYKRIWTMEIVQLLTGQIHSVWDMYKVWPSTSFDEPIRIDLVEDSEADIRSATEALSAEMAKRKKEV